MDSQLWDDDAQACVDKPRILSEACGESTQWNENLKKCENKCSNYERWDAESGTCKEICVGGSRKWNVVEEKCESFLHSNNFTPNKSGARPKNLKYPIFKMTSFHIWKEETLNVFREECAFKCEQDPECDFFKIEKQYSTSTVCQGGNTNKESSQGYHSEDFFDVLVPYNGTINDYPFDSLYYMKN